VSDPWAERLSEYLDGDLDPAELRALEDHLEGCASCRAATVELRRVGDRLRNDPVTRQDEPTEREWRAVRAIITRRPRRWMIPAALAAGLLGVIGVASQLKRPSAVLPRPAESSAAWLASRELERALQTRLSGTMVTLVDRGLAEVDRAIAESERALASDPGNEVLVRHLRMLYDWRLATLRNAIASLSPST